MKDLGANSRVSGTWLEAYESDMCQAIEREEDNMSTLKGYLEQRIDTAKDWVDKLLHQLEDLPIKEKEAKERRRRAVIIFRDHWRR